VGIHYWGTLKKLLEAKSCGLAESIAPYLNRLGTTGLWIVGKTRQCILKLADEGDAAPETRLFG
jgi:predicted nucleic acid-binding protein